MFTSSFSRDASARSHCAPGLLCDDRAARLRREQLKVRIWNLRRLLQVATGGSVPEDIVAALNFVAAHSDEFERAFVAWIDLIEILVRHEERAYGSTPGRGALKAAELKEVIRYL